MTTLNTSYEILVDNSQKPMTLGLTVSETTMSPCRSLGSLEYSFCQRAVPGHKYWFRIGDYNVLYFLLSVASRQNLSSHSLYRISHRLIPQTQIISCHLVFLYLRPPRRASLINAHFYKLDSSFTPQPPSCTSKQTWIYNSHDLWSIREPKVLPSTQPFVYTCTHYR